MFEWLWQNLGTIIVCLALIGVVIGVIAGMIRDKKRGRSSCGGSCGGCPMSGECHKNK